MNSTILLINITSPTKQQTIYQRVSLNDYPICVVCDGERCDADDREDVIRFLTTDDVNIIDDIKRHVHVDTMFDNVVLCVNAISTEYGKTSFTKSTKHEIKYNELLHEISIDVQ